MLAFPQMFWFDSGSSIQQNTNNIFHVVRFYSDVNFDIASNFLKSLLATHYDSYLFFLS